MLVRFVPSSQPVLVLTCLVPINPTALVLEVFPYQTSGLSDCKPWIYHSMTAVFIQFVSDQTLVVAHLPVMLWIRLVQYLVLNSQPLASK